MGKILGMENHQSQGVGMSKTEGVVIILGSLLIGYVTILGCVQCLGLEIH
jgi:hypothetical protein